MRIKVDNFIIEPVDPGFDLLQTKEVRHIDKNRKHTGMTSMKEEVILMNASYRSCLRHIVHLNVGSSTDTVGLSVFLERYKHEVNRIEELAGVVTERV